MPSRHQPLYSICVELFIMLDLSFKYEYLLSCILVALSVMMLGAYGNDRHILMRHWYM